MDRLWKRSTSFPVKILAFTSLFSAATSIPLTCTISALHTLLAWIKPSPKATPLDDQLGRVSFLSRCADMTPGGKYALFHGTVSFNGNEPVRYMYAAESQQAAQDMGAAPLA